MFADRIIVFATAICAVVLWPQDLALAGEHSSLVTPARSSITSFGVYWPPQDPAYGTNSKGRALLNGELNVDVQSSRATGSVASLRIVLTRPADEAGRAFWNSRLAFSEIDWMREVRVWDVEQRWLWPNLAYLLRLHGKERVERYGGVDPGKGVDNDFAAVLIRQYDLTREIESEETKRSPLVSAEWHPAGVPKANAQTIVHSAESDEFTLHLAQPGQQSRGRASIWLIYADFLGAKPPAAWPKDSEYAGGILAYFDFDWLVSADGSPELHIEQSIPPRATRFDWERWTLRTLASPNSKQTAKLSNRGLIKQQSPKAEGETVSSTNQNKTPFTKTNRPDSKHQHSARRFGPTLPAAMQGVCARAVSGLRPSKKNTLALPVKKKSC